MHVTVRLGHSVPGQLLDVPLAVIGLYAAGEQLSRRPALA